MSQVREAALALALTPLPDSPQQCLAQVEELAFARDRLEAAIAVRAAHVHAAGAARERGHASTKTWLQSGCGMSRRTACRTVALGVELARLPEIRARFAAGNLTEAIVAAICAATTGLSDADAAKAETILLELAGSAGPQEIAKAGRYLRAVLDPDGELRDAGADFDARFLLVRETDAGGVEGEFRLPREAAARLRALLDAYAKPKAQGDDRPLRVRNADALIALLEQQITTELLVLINAESLPDDPTRHTTTPRQPTPGHATPADTVPSDTVPADTVPGDTPRDTAPGGTTGPGDVSSGDSAPKDSAPKGSATDGMTGDGTTSDGADGDVASGDVTPSEAAPDDAVPGDITSGGTVPDDVAPGDAVRSGGPAGANRKETVWETRGEAGEDLGLDHTPEPAPESACGGPGSEDMGPDSADPGSTIFGGTGPGRTNATGTGIGSTGGGGGGSGDRRVDVGDWWWRSVLRTLPGLLLSTGQLLPIIDIHRLARTSTLVRLVMNADGQALDMGRKTRLATPAQRRAIAARYDTCWVKGCPLPASMCQVDHLDNWSEGGHTDLARLGPACQFHNRDRYLHPDRYQRRQIGPDRWEFIYIDPSRVGGRGVRPSDPETPERSETPEETVSNTNVKAPSPIRAEQAPPEGTPPREATSPEKARPA
ncbi:DUF222 domain-containing protein [Sphaerimonospora sp. CA-214678]|uniref:HNH endonuclease signature motif containing protein n=1 Tax=Sphaerimonospora sp. CA-214678 TaxID=3240029 RepID=UPI003D8BA431